MLHTRGYIIKCLKIKYIFIFKVVYNPGWGCKIARTQNVQFCQFGVLFGCDPVANKKLKSFF
jgi:hypothetical protein